MPDQPSTFQIAKAFVDKAEEGNEVSEQEQFKDFDRQMTRMFKGIIGRKTRRSMLRHAIERAQAEGRA